MCVYTSLRTYELASAAGDRLDCARSCFGKFQLDFDGFITCLKVPIDTPKNDGDQKDSKPDEEDKNDAIKKERSRSSLSSPGYPSASRSRSKLRG